MADGILAPALACAAWLLNYSGPLPEVEYWAFSPKGTTLCALTRRERCDAITMKFPEEQGGAIVVALAPNASFALKLREAVNVVRLTQGRPIHGIAAEDEGDALQARWRECPQARLEARQPL
jgi:hypothetical protein